MTVYAFISLLAALLAVGLGAFVLGRGPEQRQNRLFLWMTLALAANALVELGYRSAGSAHAAQVVWRLDLFWALPAPLCLHFTLAFTGGIRKLGRAVPLVLYLPAGLFTALDLAGHWFTGAPVRVAWGWAYGPPRIPALVAVPAVWSALVGLAAIAVAAWFSVRAPDASRRTQARLTLVGMSLPILAGIATEALFNVLQEPAPSATTAAFVLGCIPITYALARHNLLALTPRSVAPSIADAMPDALLLADARQRLTWVNAAACRLLGSTKRELAGRPLASIVGGALVASPTLLEGAGVQDAEVDLLRADGGRVLLSVAVTRVARAGASGPVGFICIARDVSARKAAEEELRRHRDHLEELVAARTADLEAREAELRQLHKMEAIGTLAGGVAHDINNVLAAIMGLAESLRAAQDRDGAAMEDLDGILAACRSGRDLTRNLLGFARRGRLRRESFHLDDVVTDVTSLLRRTVPKGITVRTELGFEVPAVQGDPDQIQNALMNLVLNGLQAMGNKGELLVTTGELRLGSEQAARHGVPAGRYACVHVVDSGAGMDSSTLERAFEPFFTTKADGTGLGLPMVYGVARSHGGVATIESRPGEGTRAGLLLPARLTTPDAPRRRETAGSELAKGSGTILVVDDEELVRVACRRMLERLGYDALLAPDAETAVSLYRGRHAEIVAVMLDLLMPGTDGLETAVMLREVDPAVRILLVTGYVDEDRAASMARAGAAAVLQKPYDLDRLSRVLASVLRPAPGAARV